MTDEAEKPRPEPTLRKRAADDADAIKARLDELARDRAEALNRKDDK